MDFQRTHRTLPGRAAAMGTALRRGDIAGYFLGKSANKKKAAKSAPRSPETVGSSSRP